MDNIVLPLILTTVSGLSTMIGAFIIFVSKKPSINILVFSLSFSATIMFGVSILELIPTGFSFLIKYYSVTVILLPIIIGMIFTSLIDCYIPENNQEDQNNLYKIGVFSMIAICFHNIPEGIITFMSSYQDIMLGITLTIAITMHNIPEDCIQSVMCYK